MLYDAFLKLILKLLGDIVKCCVSGRGASFVKMID